MITETRLAFISQVVLTALIILSCTSAPYKPRDSYYASIIDYMGKELGAPVPTWITKESRDLEKERDFEGMVVFKFEETGKSLDGLRRWAVMFSAPSELAARISTRVEETFVAAQQDNPEHPQIRFERIVSAISKAEISGYRKYDEWWVLRQYGKAAGEKAGSREYTYYVLYIIPRSVLEKYLATAAAKALEVGGPSIGAGK